MKKIKKILLLSFTFIPVFALISCIRKQEINQQKNENNSSAIKPQVELPNKSNSTLGTYQSIFVNSIIDGDTFFDNQGNKYRIHGIDTPEKTKNKNNSQIPTTGLQHQYALKAKEFLASQILNKQVKIIHITNDAYSRKVVQVLSDNQNLSILLVKQGLAKVAYISKEKRNKFYYKDSSFIDALYEAQQQAMSKRLNIWKEPNQISKIFPRRG